MSRARPLPLRLAGHRHEPHRKDPLLAKSRIGASDPHELLLADADWKDEPSPDLELIEQGRRDLRRGGGHYDRVERGLVGPAAVAISLAHDDVPVPQARKIRLRTPGQLGAR